MKIAQNTWENWGFVFGNSRFRTPMSVKIYQQGQQITQFISTRYNANVKPQTSRQEKIKIGMTVIHIDSNSYTQTVWESHNSLQKWKQFNKQFRQYKERKSHVDARRWMRVHSPCVCVLHQNFLTWYVRNEYNKTLLLSLVAGYCTPYEYSRNTCRFLKQEICSQNFM